MNNRHPKKSKRNKSDSNPNNAHHQVISFGSPYLAFSARDAPAKDNLFPIRCKGCSNAILFSDVSENSNKICCLILRLFPEDIDFIRAYN